MNFWLRINEIVYFFAFFKSKSFFEFFGGRINEIVYFLPFSRISHLFEFFLERINEIVYFLPFSRVGYFFSSLGEEKQVVNTSFRSNWPDVNYK